MLKPLLHQLGYDELDELGIQDNIKKYSLPGNALLIYEVENKIVGFIALHIFDSFHSAGQIGRITAFCVDEEYRSKGIGIQLLQQGENFFIEHKCIKIEVTSNNRRTAAHAFYLNRGYVEDSRKFVRYIR